MMNTLIYVMLFIMGIFFGSFFTLAIYRIPLKQDILFKHSYCPNCNHKLGVLDLIPLLSYIFLGGKCRYCGKKIRIRYFLLEILSGFTFVLYTMSLNIDISNLTVNKIVYLICGLLYIATLFIIAGIDKEKKQIQKSIVVFGLIVELAYIIYVCTFKNISVYGYVIYLLIMLFLIIADTIYVRKKLESSYILQILFLITYMTIFTSSVVTYFTVILGAIEMAIGNIIRILERKNKSIKPDNTRNNKQIPVGFLLCINNIIFTILFGFVMII